MEPGIKILELFIYLYRWPCSCFIRGTTQQHPVIFSEYWNNLPKKTVVCIILFMKSGDIIYKNIRFMPNDILIQRKYSLVAEGLI